MLNHPGTHERLIAFGLHGLPRHSRSSAGSPTSPHSALRSASG